MKTITTLCWILSGLMLAGLDGAEPEYRVFTNKAGVGIRAAVVAARDGKVTLKKDGGKTYAVPLETLSDADKEYVKLWMEENVHVSLDLRFEKKRLGTRKGNKIESTDWIFNVTVTNRGFNDLEEVSFKYATFKDIHDRYAEEKNGIVDAATGSIDAANLARTKSLTFKTAPMKIEKENSKTYEGLLDGVEQYTYKKWDESLCGIAVEIFVKGKLVERREFGKVMPVPDPNPQEP